MPTYRANATVCGGKHLGDIEADNAVDAIEKAYSLPTASVGLCHQCSDQVEDAEVTSVYVVNADDPTDEADDRPR